MSRYGPTDTQVAHEVGGSMDRMLTVNDQAGGSDFQSLATFESTNTIYFLYSVLD